MAKVDYKKQYKDIYFPSAKEPMIIDVPEMQFVMVDGVGAPEGEQYQDAVQALYGITFTIKMWPKKGKTPAGYFEYVIPPLEGLWWMNNPDGTQMEGFMQEAREKWQWTSMIRQPEFVTAELFAEALAEIKEKKPNPKLDEARFETFIEGLCVQIMHIGPYSEEGPTIERMHQYAHDQGYRLRDKHHEVYLGDPRKTDPKKLKTVLRHPIEKTV